MRSVWSGMHFLFLGLRGATMQPHSSRRITLTLAQSLYHEAENRSAEFEVSNPIFASGIRVQQNNRSHIGNESAQPFIISEGS